MSNTQLEHSSYKKLAARWESIPVRYTSLIYLTAASLMVHTAASLSYLFQESERSTYLDLVLWWIMNMSVVGIGIMLVSDFVRGRMNLRATLFALTGLISTYVAIILVLFVLGLIIGLSRN